MRILEKYVLSGFIGAFVFCITLLIVLGMIGDILGFLDDIFKKGIPLLSILSFYLYLAPFAFVNMVPFASLLSAVYVFNSLSKNHEVTAVIASGLSLWKLLRPVLLTTFVLCLITLIVNEKFVPSTMKKAGLIRREELERAGEEKNNDIKDIAVYGKGGQMIFARAFDPDNDVLKDVIIQKQSEDRDITEKISARLVKWRNKGYWLGEDVIVFNVAEDGKFTGNPEVYKNRKVFIGEEPEDFVNNQWDPKMMNYRQLKNYIKAFSFGSEETLRRLRVDLYYKLSLPFTALITVLVGVPFSISSGRSNALIGMAKGIGVAILYLPVMAVSLALGKGGVLPPLVSAWSSNVLFALFGIYFINKKS